MLSIPEKSLEDLEYNEVLKQCADFAITPMGKERIYLLKPLTDSAVVLNDLQKTSEYKASFDNENRIPNHGFDDLSPYFKLLKIENSVLELEAFRNLARNTETTNTLVRFLEKFKTYYPTLYGCSESLYEEKEIKPTVDGVIDRFGEVRNDASEALFSIRKQIQQLRGKISSSFNKALSQFGNADYLDDIRESVIENRRVLAVKAMHRRKVKGAIMGSSKTGSIVFIEPEATNAQTRELKNLEFEEGEEIKKILSKLTDFFRPYLPYLELQHSFLLELDIIHAKARYAQEIGGLLPEIIEDQKQIIYKNAYHPLLLQSHKLEGKVTHPQDIELDSDNRIVVISGPNAGGKSITLKTVGLLQLLLQSGMLIPVHERSKASFFDNILTDIGDNQSIENHLSTYSYRLKNMKYFLRKCNSNTLFLIDEFGTGSDPELGGALAEVMLEDFYERKAFGLITTHYSNLKALANELPAMVNANMQFDNKTLEPVFKLVMGEAGSSFTFEVAQKNGLPFNLINRAKKKIERGKVRFDATIAKLQKERSAMMKTGQSLKEKESKVKSESDRMENMNAKLKAKLTSYQELFDHNQRMIVLGNKLNELAERYFTNNKKRPLIAELLRLVETENAKRKRKTAAVSKKEREEKKKLNEEVKQDLVKVRREKKKEKKENKIVEKAKPKLAVGDQVRLFDGRSVGSIDAIEKQKAIVNYGAFTTQVSLDLLELVQAVKKRK
ncbi:DNA mismatch repair protein MutS [Flavobacteriaceae bacterium]|jgi:DNA mismatch repair protein MutS2|nr:DNA mismatch repair protein MutS [Flavobacteriaceae bacterium]MDA9879373.1 DNA mismatch repair protein MutS [Flavobacteriaceae bacterium]